MRRLDPNTVRAVAEILCDDGGPYERHSWQLAGLFERGGWRDPPAYDGSGRVRWSAEQIEQRVEDREAIDQVLCRLCDPREYPGEPEAAGTVSQALNVVLGPDGLKVVYEGGRPRVTEITPVVSNVGITPPVVLATDLGLLVQDENIVRVLRARLNEIAICREHGAPVSAIVGLGSLIEGVLYAVLLQHDPEAAARLTAPAREGGRPRDISLAQLITEAYHRGWIQRDADAFSTELRKFRNYVHPRAQWDVHDWPDADTVKICWEVAVAALNDLGAAFLFGPSGLRP